MSRLTSILIVAGSDSGGGAGIQADLKTASALGVYAATAVTAITAQNTVGVQAVEPVSPSLVAAQIHSVLSDMRIDAVKIGMLGTAEAAHAVADALTGFSGPVVLDPVMVAKSGDPLLADDAEAALRDRLLPMADLLTPNLPEAGRLLGRATAAGPADAAEQGRALRALGPGAVLMKGGHGDASTCTDILVTGGEDLVLDAPRLDTPNTHGTGCSYSSAIAAGLAEGHPLPEAVRLAHDWLHAAIAAAERFEIGRGHGPVHHFHALWP